MITGMVYFFPENFIHFFIIRERHEIAQFINANLEFKKKSSLYICETYKINVADPAEK
jgi:hypothetical protein